MFVFVGCGGQNYGSYNYPVAVNPDALGESYLDITENPFVSAQEQSVSAFALDTSTAGYANIRRMSIKKNFLSLWKNIINGWK
ncbi:MAG: von Willebrand factor type A domain-containing protein [Bacilli bacterium]